ALDAANDWSLAHGPHHLGAGEETRAVGFVNPSLTANKAFRGFVRTSVAAGQHAVIRAIVVSASRADGDGGGEDLPRVSELLQRQEKRIQELEARLWAATGKESGGEEADKGGKSASAVGEETGMV
ncbi:unnamed protein product, partial [Discosporangium mesarthrocarpum]